MESKMKNPTHSFREMNLVLQLIQESQIKSKTDDLELAKEKRGHFLCRLLCPKRVFFKICVLFQRLQCLEHIFKIYILSHIRKHHFIKSSKVFSVSLRRLTSAVVNFRVDFFFRGCKYYHVSRGFIFVDCEILIILRGLIFAFARYILFISSVK